MTHKFFLLVPAEKSSQFHEMRQKTFLFPTQDGVIFLFGYISYLLSQIDKTTDDKEINKKTHESEIETSTPKRYNANDNKQNERKERKMNKLVALLSFFFYQRKKVLLCHQEYDKFVMFPFFYRQLSLLLI